MASDDGTECEVCGTAERPEGGWIYKSGDVKPVAIDGDVVRWKPKEGAKAYCSTACSLQSDTEHS